MTELVRIRGLEHDYGREPVLSIDELDLQPGRVHLAGPNGAGKTTLLRVLGTLTTPRSGRVEVAGHLIPKRARRARARVGFVGHDPSLHDALETREALTLHARLHGVATVRVDDALDAWGLEAVASTQIRRLSNGQRRRADLARALLHEPTVLLLDEPATGLDPDAKRTLSDRLDVVAPELVLLAAPDRPGLDVDRTVRLEVGTIVEGPA